MSAEETLAAVQAETARLRAEVTAAHETIAALTARMAALLGRVKAMGRRARRTATTAASHRRAMDRRASRG